MESVKEQIPTQLIWGWAFLSPHLGDAAGPWTTHWVTGSHTPVSTTMPACWLSLGPKHQIPGREKALACSEWMLQTYLWNYGQYSPSPAWVCPPSRRAKWAIAWRSHPEAKGSLVALWLHCLLLACSIYHLPTQWLSPTAKDSFDRVVVHGLPQPTEWYFQYP